MVLVNKKVGDVHEDEYETEQRGAISKEAGLTNSKSLLRRNPLLAENLDR